MGLRSGVARNPPFPLSGDWQEEAQVGQVGLRTWAPVRSRSTSGAQAVRHRVPVLWCDPRAASASLLGRDSASMPSSLQEAFSGRRVLYH